MLTDIQPNVRVAMPAMVVAEHATYRDIVSDDFQSELISMAESMTQFSFRIGDIAREITAQASAQGFRIRSRENKELDLYVTQQQIDDAVGHFCHREGRTVRYYREVAQFFPVDVRDDFDVLDFKFFVMARSFRDGWKDVLEYAACNPQMSVEAVRDHFIEQAAGTPPEADGESGDDEAVARDQGHTLLGLFSRLVNAAQRAVQSLPLSDAQKQRGVVLVGELRMWIRDTADELRE